VRFAFALALLFVASPLAAQVDTVRGYIGDTVMVPVVLEARDTAGSQVQKLSPSRKIWERNVVISMPRPVAPPPAPPPPPPPVATSDEPQDPGVYLWSDPFEYESVAKMQQCPNTIGALPNPHTVPNHSNCNDLPGAGYQLTEGRNGKALRGIYPAGGRGGPGWLSPHWGTVNFGRSVVIQFYVRIQLGQNYLPYGGKFFEAWWVNGATGRIQWSNNGELFEIALGANPGGGVNRTQQPVAPRWSDIDDGEWHRVTLLFKPNTFSNYLRTGGTTSATEVCTGGSSRDGRVAMWIDGAKIQDYSQATVDVVPLGGTGPWARQCDVDMIPGNSGSNSFGGVHHFQFPEFANGTTTGLTIDHDDLKVWRLP
jgi:hypothetical protein